jgi:tetratricopeptide (TPR) repeat protein
MVSLLRHCRTFLSPGFALIAFFLAIPTGEASGGEVGRPHYGLALPPLEIYDRLPQLKMGKVPPFSPGERAFLERVWARRAANPAKPFAADAGLVFDALLFASGIGDAAGHDKYRSQYDALLKKAARAIRDCKDDRARGEALMGFLHRGVMRGGYSSEQTSFAGIFDSGKFNCVSSAAMYYLVGTHCGLKLRAISIPGGILPGHAALDMIDGHTTLQVEATNPDGFDWATKASRPGTIVLSTISDRKDGYEIDALGLAAVIYSNRGIATTRATPARRLEACRCLVASLVLAPADASIANNVLAQFVNWGPELKEAKRHEKAVRVMEFAAAIAPQSEDIGTNYRVAYTAYVLATLEAGNDKMALEIAGRAAKSLPHEKDFQDAGHWFIRFGEKEVEAHGFEAGLAVVNRGLKVLPEKERHSLAEWRGHIFRQWSQSLLDKKDFQGSMRILARGYTMDPNDREIVDGIVYHTQEALGIAESTSRAVLVEHYRVLRSSFPALDGIADRAQAHVARRIQQLVDVKQFNKAIATADYYRELLPKPEQRAELGASAYDSWARSLSDQKDWKAAIAKYLEGIRAYPGQELLENNALATIDRWAETEIEAKHWVEAVRIYEIGLKSFPDNGHLKNAKERCQREATQTDQK